MKDNKALEELVNEMYENLEHYDTSTKTLIIKAKKEFDTIKQALTKEVSKDTNVEEVDVLKMVDEVFDTIFNGEDILGMNYKKTLEKYKRYKKTIRNYIEQHSFNVSKENDNQFLDNFKRTGTKIICNEDGSVDIEEPTKSAKEMFEELGYELVKDRSFPNLVSYVKKTECYERIEICFNVPSKTYSKELNDKVWAITNEEHQAITQQLKELEK